MAIPNIILFDGATHEQLLPLTYTRSIADLRIGILTLREKWQGALSKKNYVLSQPYLQYKYELLFSEDNLYINASCFPSKQNIEQILDMQINESLWKDDELLAFRSEDSIRSLQDLKSSALNGDGKKISSIDKINYLWDLFLQNGDQIRWDIKAIQLIANGDELGENNTILGAENIYVEEGAKVLCATINAMEGPVYIGKNAQVMEGSIIKGPFALCDHGVVKMGAKIYADTTIGPYCKVGGEVSNSILMGYSNKGHDGYLGNSVLGEWCNLGADTNNSNLKNNYGEVKVWDYKKEGFVRTGQQFCGLIMGDHSKSGINTMFNTGTVIGVASNIFGGGFPRKFVPSFSWGGAKGFIEFRMDKVYEMAENMMKRRNVPFTEEDKELLIYIYNETSKFRNYN